MIDLDGMLRIVVQENYTDLHLKPGSFPMVRHVKDLRPIDDLPVSPEDTRGILEKILPEQKRVQFAEGLELDFAYGISDEFRFRVNAHYHLGEVGLSFRLCRTDILSFKKLRLPPVVRKLAELDHGLILVTGITGSGKSTTLATMINHINETRRCHIITVEDPVEFIHRDKMSLVTQREVGLDTRSFVEALRRGLRQDPDVILIGEMRDAETIRTAISAAETGHLVFSTLHVVQAHMAVDRILSFFDGPEQRQVRMQLAMNLQGVIAQHLLRNTENSTILPALEVLIGTPTVRKLVMDGKTLDIRQAMQNGEGGMQTLDQHLFNLVKSGLVDPLEAMKISDNPMALKRNLEGGYAGGDKQAILGNH